MVSGAVGKVRYAGPMMGWDPSVHPSRSSSKQTPATKKKAKNKMDQNKDIIQTKTKPKNPNASQC